MTTLESDPLIVDDPQVLTPERPLEQPKRKVRGLTRVEVVEYAIALSAGVHLAVLLRFLLDWNDLLGSTLIALIAFIGVHYAIVRARSSPDVAVDKAVTTVMWT